MFYQQRETYDAIVVGSGVTGGYAAKELCEKGLKTILLERGPDAPHQKAYVTEHKQNWEFPLRDRRLTPASVGPDFQVQSRMGSFREANRHFFINDRMHPYVEQKPFTWIQGNQVGGKSLTWGRQCYRWSDLDFEANLREGVEIDWPIRYRDIAPWYSYAERFVGVSGERLGLPHLPDGEFLPPMEMNVGEKFVKTGLEKAFPGRHMTIGRVAVLTQNLGDRAACHYCGPCFRGYSTGSYFSSQSASLPAARATGNLTLRPNAVVESIIYDEGKNRAVGVRFFDAETKEAHEVYARVVFLNASTLGTTRLMLNSKSGRFPNGIGNDSGALGRYLMDHHFRVGARGEVPGIGDRYFQGNRPNGIYVPRFRNLDGPKADRLAFSRGYGYQGGATRADWTRGTQTAGFGAELKERLREPGPWTFHFTGFGECLPRHDNYVDLDPERKDAYGIPALRIDCSWGPNELAMRKDMAASAAEMLKAAGCENVYEYDDLDPNGYGAEPGLGIHEMGTARMGRDPKTSVLNGFNQVHAVPNLFVTDGACMTSSSCVNPSITYLALTARAVDYATAEMDRRNI